jgi:hypothetical protein
MLRSDIRCLKFPISKIVLFVMVNETELLQASVPFNKSAAVFLDLFFNSQN